MWVWIVAIVALSALVAGMYVRVAPSDPARWHKSAEPWEIGDYPGANSFIAVRTAQKDTLAALDRIILATPRTERLAGSPDEGMLTYVTRSRLMAFPDYTTVSHGDGTVQIHGRARFGQSDLGVNKARITAWLAATPEISGP